MAHTAFDFHLANWLGVLLGAVPMLANLGILAYSRARLPRDRLTTVFQLYLVSLVAWQLYDVMVRLSATPETAVFWRGYLRSAQIFCVPLGLHFAMLYAERDRIVNSWWFWAVLYVPPLLQIGGYQAGTIHEVLHYSPGWGWLSRGYELGWVSDVHMAVGATLALTTWGVLCWNVWRVRADRERRDAATVLAVGLGIPTMLGVFTEVGLPFMGHQQWPITSTTATIWTAATAIGLARYQLFEVSTPSAAQAVLETITDTVMIARADGRLLFVNEQGARVFGLDRAHVQTHHLKDLFSNEGEALAFFAGRWNDALSGTHLSGLEARLRTGVGPAPFLISLAAFPLSRRGDPGIALVLHDVARIKRVEMALLEAKDVAEEANRAKSLFLANMSHELRTPLNAIIGYAELLEEDATDEATAGDLHRIRRSGRYLLDLINDVLDLSKVESGKLEVSLEAVDVGDLLRSTQPTFQQLVERNQNTLRIQVDDAMPRVRADPMRLRQVLLNLVSNAAKFTENGTVVVWVTQADGRIRIDIEDDGVGMDAEQQSRLFGLFAQVHDSVARERFGGTGLGLALSRHLCELMDGDIHVRSAPGEGSTFTVDLPTAEGGSAG